MIKHIVLLNWKAGTTAEQVAQVTAEFAKLQDSIEEIQSYQFGPDAGIFKGNASYALLAEFNSEADLKRYAAHPLHQAFLENVAAPILDSFQSLQFNLNDK